MMALGILLELRLPKARLGRFRGFWGILGGICGFREFRCFSGFSEFRVWGWGSWCGIQSKVPE